MRDNLSPAAFDPYPAGTLASLDHASDGDHDLTDTFPTHDTPPLVLLAGILIFAASLLAGLVLLIMSTHRALVALAAALILCALPSIASAQYTAEPRGRNNLTLDACAGVPNPGPGWTCVGGGYLPPGHPDIPRVPPPVPPSAGPGTPDQPLPPNPDGFKVGKTYRRTATGALVFIVSIGQAKNGLFVTTAECLIESVQDQCYYPGDARLILSNANTLGWVIEE
jgi:hypothetical protein